MTTTSPYINTVINTTVLINANQMNNEIYLHMKNNVRNKIEGKCFRNYGFISKVYEIRAFSGGVIEAENPMASAKYKVSVACRLCMPLKESYIICKIEIMNAMLMRLSNGPIRFIIAKGVDVNKDNFKIVKNGIYSKNPSKLLEAGDYVKVKITNRKFDQGNEIIHCMGVLQALATQKEIDDFIADEY